jgi:3-oxoacyl-[acyl-carrier protein] reductase
MTVSLAGQTAIVTGGGNGFGEHKSKGLAKEGVNVVVADIGVSDAERVVNEISGEGGKAIAVEVDVSDPDQVERMVQTTLDHFGQIDVLVNNAGITAPSGEFLETATIEAWDKVFSVNVRGVFLCSRAVLPHMVERKSGHIVNVSSTTARFEYTTIRSLPYTTTKYTIEGFNHCLAMHMKKDGIRVNALCPTVAYTDFQEGVPRSFFKDHRVGKPHHTVPVLLYILKEMEGTGKSIMAIQFYEERGLIDEYTFIQE